MLADAAVQPHPAAEGDLEHHLVALGVEDDGEARSPLQIAQYVMQSIVNLHTRINATEQAPTGNDYKKLYVLVNCGLIDLLKSLGDPCNFGK